MAVPRHPEWLTAVAPDELLNVLRPPTVWPAELQPMSPRTARRLQLLGVACARMVWGLLPTDARSAVLVRERFADGRASDADLRASALRWSWAAHTAAAVQHAAACACYAAGYYAREEHGPPNWDASAAARGAAMSLACRAAGPAPPGGPRQQAWHDLWNATFAPAREHQTELVRDIFPPSGYVTPFPPDLRTSTVVALAEQMDASGDFSAVPILADALQDAGCADDVILDRCRAPSQVHCRGNWVVDLVLGRA